MVDVTGEVVVITGEVVAFTGEVVVITAIGVAVTGIMVVITGIVIYPPKLTQNPSLNLLSRPLTEWAWGENNSMS